MAEKKTPRISIDLCEDSEERRRIIHSSILTVVEACGEFFKGLERKRGLIETIRVTFTSFHGLFAQPGPCITLYLRDPLGNTTSHGTDYRFMGDGGPEPTKEEIIEHLNKAFDEKKKEFLVKSLNEINDARKEIKAIL